jgi:type IV pilus assembly protein PilW
LIMRRIPRTRSPARGFSLVEMMVAVAVGLVLLAVMSVVYVNSRGAANRQSQLGGLQQGVRTAFEHMTFDTRMVGHLGCFTRLDTLAGSGTGLADNFAKGVEGYEFANTGPTDSLTLPAGVPANTVSASDWSNSTDATTASIPLADIAGGVGVGLSPGSDVLIVRGAASGQPVRLTGNVAGGSTTAIPIENRSTGTCPNGSNNVMGFCDGSFGVIASCSAAQTFRVTTAGASLALPSPISGSTLYSVGAAEVLPVHTVVYYVKRSSSGTSTSLYRRVLDGAQTDVALQEQELIEGVESMQIRYGVDTDTELDGLINGEYVTADEVTQWSRVIAVRISLLMRSLTPIESSMALPSARVNGLTVTFPTTGQQFDRRVFTTTVSLRNRIAYAMP